MYLCFEKTFKTSTVFQKVTKVEWEEEAICNTKLHIEANDKDDELKSFENK